MQAARGASLSPSDPPTTTPDPRRHRRLLVLFALVAATAYAVDLATKQWALAALEDRPPVQVIGELLQFDLVFNPGAAFSTGTGYTPVLSVISIGAVLVVLWVVRRVGSTLWAVGLGFLLGGVLGNLTDRLVRDPGVLEGHVIDFLRLPNWPVFNVADICINLAAGVIILQTLRGVSLSGERHGDDQKAPAEEPDSTPGAERA